MKELRSITFSARELTTAVIERRQKVREHVPNGTVLGLTYMTTQKNDVSARIRISDDYGVVHTIDVMTNELVAAAVEYCINRRIILPRHSFRWVEVINRDEFSLFLDIRRVKKIKKPVPAK